MSELTTREPEVTRASLLNRTMYNLREAWRGDGRLAGRAIRGT